MNLAPARIKRTPRNPYLFRRNSAPFNNRGADVHRSSPGARRPADLRSPGAGIGVSGRGNRSEIGRGGTTPQEEDSVAGGETAPAPEAPADAPRPRTRTRGSAVALRALAVVAVAAALALAALALSPGRAGHKSSDRPATVAVRQPALAGTHSLAYVADPTSPSEDAVIGADPDAPPPDPTPQSPGQVVAAGVDQSDPFLFLDGFRYFLFTSGIPGQPFVNVPVTSSSDFGGWSPVTDAMPDLPPWVAPGFTWAPDVHRFGSQYVLYFTALVRDSNPSMECIGDAVGSAPTGPFFPAARPFICQWTLGGDIDPRVFVDPSGAPYLLWKSDQNIGGATTPTEMWSQPLSPDGLDLVGRPVVLLGPDQPWEGSIVEAPDMALVHGTYWLVYSGNWFNQPAYGIGVASCAGPQGPCRDLPDNPLLASNAQGAGPGEASFFADGAGVWLLYSPWRSLAPHPDVPPRPVDLTRLGFGPAGPYLAAGGPPPPLVALDPALAWAAPPTSSAP